MIHWCKGFTSQHVMLSRVLQVTPEKLTGAVL